MTILNIDKLNAIFYYSLSYSFILFLLPSKVTWGVYSPNIFGWSMITCFILSILTYVILLIIDLKNKTKVKKLIIRSMFLILILSLSMTYWFYLKVQSGNI